ncbi:MAG TPA: phage terminase large subunit family protein [Pyrinomonadaceae bacterium]|nr:phage terminase large subunit family protein [Pyrinomonadaceae bacterium]
MSQWADSYRYLSAERSARPGRWRTSLVPYTREIMDCASRSDVRKIVFISSTQTAKTETISNIIGFYIHADASPQMYVAETELKARAWSQECLAPMIRDTPVLQQLVEDPRSRDSGNTIEGKSYPGGHLAIAWATSAAMLSSRPRRIVGCDERDGFKGSSEGDPVALAEERTNTFENSLVIEVSTPRDAEAPPAGSPEDAPWLSPIERSYEETDKRKYFVPCPHCSEFQTLEWSNVHWDSPEEAHNAYYVCVNGCLITNDSKADMLARGQWRAEKPFRGKAGFKIWAGYSPFVTFGQLAEKWLAAQKSTDRLRVFINTSLAQSWKPLADKIETHDLEGRLEPYPAEVPRGVLLLTAGVDVQGDRLEYDITGWGLDEESWAIRYGCIYGDPASSEVWEELKERLSADFMREGDTLMRVSAACIDSGGHHTQEVYRFCRSMRGRKFWAIKGANTPGQPLAPRQPTLQGKPAVKLFKIGTETAKDTLAAHLKVKEPGPGYCHFPNTTDDAGVPVYGEAYFKQLCSERAVTKYTRGVGVRVWQKIKQGARNEALDCKVYAMAAKAILNPDMRRLHKKAESVTDNPAPEGEAREEAPPVPQRQRPRFVAARRGGFVKGFR